VLPCVGSAPVHHPLVSGAALLRSSSSPVSSPLSLFFSVCSSSSREPCCYADPRRSSRTAGRRHSSLACMHCTYGGRTLAQLSLAPAGTNYLRGGRPLASLPGHLRERLCALGQRGEAPCPHATGPDVDEQYLRRPSPLRLIPIHGGRMEVEEKEKPHGENHGC
jgi:hypothetical protein